MIDSDTPSRFEGRNQHRRGASLIELLTLLGLAAVLMSLAAASLYRGFNIQRATMEAVVHQRQVDSFRSRLKSDLSHACSVVWNKQSLALSCPARGASRAAEIVYEFDSGRIQRSAFDGDKRLLSSQVWLWTVELLDAQIDPSGTVPVVGLNLRSTPNQSIAFPEEFLWIFRLSAEVER